jgi:hypothetical protein
MSLVNVLVQSDAVVPALLQGVVVSVVTTESLIETAARAMTDSSGIAGFDVPDGTYELRAYKRGVIFQSARIEVVGDGAYTLSGTLLNVPVATDPRLCRCTGRFVDQSNRPIAGVTVILTPSNESGLEVPKVVDGDMVSSQPAYLTTDQFGYVSIDLFRGGEYFVTFSGNDDVVWNFKVPDRPSANLIDLIHPQPLSLAWDSTVAPAGAISLALLNQVLVPITVLFSDYEQLTQGVDKWLELSSSNPDVVQARFFQDSVLVVAVARGTEQITVAAKKGLFPNRVPDYSISAVPLVVTVT